MRGREVAGESRQCSRPEETHVQRRGDTQPAAPGGVTGKGGGVARGYQTDLPKLSLRILLPHTSHLSLHPPKLKSPNTRTLISEYH